MGLLSVLCYTSCPVALPSSQTMRAAAAGFSCYVEILTLTLKSSDNGAQQFFLFSLIPTEALASETSKHSLSDSFLFSLMFVLGLHAPPTRPLNLLSAKSGRAYESGLKGR